MSFRTALAFVAAITLAAPAAHAEGGPAAQPTPSNEEAYLASLEEEFAKALTKGRAGIAACNAAYDLYLRATRDQEKARAELGALSPNPLLEEAQAPYRAALAAEIEAAKAQVAEAKADAELAGKELSAAITKISALAAQIHRLEARGVGLGEAKPYRPRRNSSPPSIEGLPLEFKECMPAL